MENRRLKDKQFYSTISQQAAFKTNETMFYAKDTHTHTHNREMNAEKCTL